MFIKPLFFVIALIALLFQKAYGQQTYSSLDSLLQHTAISSSVMRINQQQQRLASLTHKAAIGNAFNPRIPLTASLIDNSKLPVNFIPAEVFGGPAGSFRQITLGQQYISTLAISPQIDLINPGQMAKIKSASLNEKLTDAQTGISKLTLFENTNTCYYNILSQQAQITVLEQHQILADSLVTLVKNRYALGLARQQDVNDAMANLISIKDKTGKLRISLQQQYLILQTLMDTDTAILLSENLMNFNPFATILQAQGTIKLQYQELKTAFSEQETKAAFMQNYPVLSLVGNYNLQNNSNNHLLDNNNSWIKSYYWGLRLSWDLPTNVNKLTTMANNRIIAQTENLQLEHVRRQNAAEQQQMNLDLQNYREQYTNALQIMQLKQDNYYKSRQQYNENILGLDKLIISETDWLNSRINMIAALAGIAHTQQKISINNSIQ